MDRRVLVDLILIDEQLVGVKMMICWREGGGVAGGSPKSKMRDGASSISSTRCKDLQGKQTHTVSIQMFSYFFVCLRKDHDSLDAGLSLLVIAALVGSAMTTVRIEIGIDHGSSATPSHSRKKLS